MFRRSLWLWQKRRAIVGCAVATVGGGTLYVAFVSPRAGHRHLEPTSLPFLFDENGDIQPPSFPNLKTRAEQLLDMKASDISYSSMASALVDAYRKHELVNQQESPPAKGSEAELNQEIYDILVIGGGATGSGIALDAVTRGLKVALVDRDDFAGATSSKSTKLVHGGVRYLESALWKLDYKQYQLVKEALHERKYFLHIAPHLSTSLPIMLPVDSWWKVPYYWMGIKCYDFLAGSENIGISYFLSRIKALAAFPMLKKDKIVGALVYYDGSHNDSRMNVSLAMTAAFYGASIANYVDVTGLEKDQTGKVIGVRAEDRIASRNGEPVEPFSIRAKVVINATGPYADNIRNMDGPQEQNLIVPSAGTHIVLPGYYSPDRMGLIDPSTPDGRVLFFLPWQSNTIAGTTESQIDLEQNPAASENDVNWILKEIQAYVSPDIKVRRGDVLATWSGIRPLVRDPKAKNSKSLVRNHLIDISKSGLITIAGGKWTTYRQMAEETVHAAIQSANLVPKAVRIRDISGTQGVPDDAVLNGSCQTHKIRLIGAHGFSQMLYISLIQHFGIETNVAKHLAESYGDRAWQVVALCAPTEERFPVRGIPLSDVYPYVDGEVRYAVRHEYAQTAVDLLARRTRLAFLNAQAALGALPTVIDIMAEELGWDRRRKDVEWQETLHFLGAMGLPKGDLSSTPEDVRKGLAAHYPEKEFELYARHDKPADKLESDKKSSPMLHNKSRGNK